MPKITDENSPASDRPTRLISRRSMREYLHIPAPRGFRRMFSSREKVVDGLKTLAWVLPLTLLIWIYAEREQVITPNSPNVSNVGVTLQNNDTGRSVEFSGSQTPTVNLQLTGPQQAVEQVKDVLTMHIPHETLPISIGGLGVGEGQPVNIMNSIRDLDIFRNNGVTVEDCQPKELRVNVYKMGHCEVPVQIPPWITNLSPESSFDPPRVTVSGPQQLVDLVDPVKNGEVKIYPDLSGVDVLKQPGPHQLTAVPLRFSSSEEQLLKLKVSSPQVSAKLVVMASDVDYVVNDVPIYDVILSTAQGSFDVSLNDATISNLHVSGPAVAIQPIKDSTLPGHGIKAYLDIDPTDDVKGSISRALRYELPDGVHVSDQDKDRAVTFTVKRVDR